MGQIAWALCDDTLDGAAHIPVQVVGCCLRQGSWAYTCAHINIDTTAATTSTHPESHLTEWHKGYNLGPMSKGLSS